jgi:hypothetical protein
MGREVADRGLSGATVSSTGPSPVSHVVAATKLMKLPRASVFSKAFADFVEPIHDYSGRDLSRIMVFDKLLATQGSSFTLLAIGKNNSHLPNCDLKVWFSPALSFPHRVFSRHQFAQ